MLFFIFSDLDEIASVSSLSALSSNLLCIPEYHTKNSYILRNNTVYGLVLTPFLTKSGEDLLLFFLNLQPLTQPLSNLQGICQISVTYVIPNAGVHISYLKCTINSKMHNSHGLRYLKNQNLSSFNWHPSFFAGKTPKNP